MLPDVGSTIDFTGQMRIWKWSLMIYIYKKKQCFDFKISSLQSLLHSLRKGRTVESQKKHMKLYICWAVRAQTPVRLQRSCSWNRSSGAPMQCKTFRVVHRKLYLQLHHRSQCSEYAGPNLKKPELFCKQVQETDKIQINFFGHSL